jgi:G:T-mismatch repair DNA endonuclease (very short patch repair protein)
MSASLKGRKAPNKGKSPSPETREKQSKAKRGYKWSKEAIEARKQGMKKAKAKMSAGQKRRWSNLTPEQRSDAIRTWHQHAKRPTKPELVVGELIEKLKLPFVYNGNGQIRIDGLQPDFISEELKTVVLVHGCYWHRCYLCYPEKFDSMETEGLLCDETERYRTEGYYPVVIWEHELEGDFVWKLAV